MRDYLLNAPPRRQVSIAIGAAVLLAAILFALWFSFLRTEYRPAFTSLQPADAATIVAELEKRKQPYKLAENGTVILVAADRADAVRLDIMSTDLPLKGTVGFELFNKTDMGLTDFAQRINYQRALQGELARTILAMDGVEAVRVHLALGEDRIFRDDQVPPKASVVVRMKGGNSVSPVAADGIQRLIAAAVDKLDPANVVILDEAGAVASMVQPVASVETPGSPSVEKKRAIEQYYQARIREAVNAGYPATDVGVTVWAGGETAMTSEGTNALTSWSPDNRDFPLNVILSPKGSLATGAMQDLRTLAANAIDMNDAVGDDISFGPTPTALTVPAPERAPLRRPDYPRASIATEKAGTDFAWVPAMLSLSFALLLAAFLAARNRRPEKLSPASREAFAERLSQLLREEEDRGVESAA